MAARGRLKKLDAEALWSYALRALQRKPHSKQELKQKLKQRAQSDADLNSVLVKVREYGFIDDRKFSEALAEVRLQNQGFGRMRVLRELRAKRVASDVAAAAVERAFSGTDEQQLVEQFLARKYRGKDLGSFLADEKNMMSTYRRLRLAGFSSSVSLAVLRRHSNRIDEWSEVEEEE